MSTMRFAVTVGLLLASLAIGSPAIGAPTNTARKAARAMAEAGLTLYEAQRWMEAYDLFRQANAQVPAPTFVLYMAHCKRNLGELVEARSLYQEVANADVPPGAPAQFRDAKQTAAGELEPLDERIPAISVVVTGQGAAVATVTLDDAPLAEGERARKLLNPGHHLLRATAPGADPVQRSIELAEGDSETVRLELAAAFSDGGDKEPDAGSGSLAPAVVAFAVGGAGLGVGIVTGVMSLNEVDDLKSRCRPDNHCPSADRAQADEADALATASTVGFVVAGVAVAAGTALLIFRPGGSSTVAKWPAVRLGPGSLSLVGAF